jgi:hypothetical protein
MKEKPLLPSADCVKVSARELIEIIASILIRDLVDREDIQLQVKTNGPVSTAL